MRNGSAFERQRMSRRGFLKRAGIAGAVLATGPTLWRQAGAVVDPPFGVHLQFGNRPAHDMVASWLTAETVSRPHVRFGTSPSDLDDTVAAETRTYIDGLSGTEVFTHHAAMSGLRPNETYFYEVAHDGSVAVAGTFRTAPAGRSARFSFTSFGDQSIPDQLGNPPTLPWTRYAGLIVPEVEMRQPLFHLLNGDLCYANVAGREHLRVATWQSFFKNNSRSARFRPWMPAAGNHENERLDGRPGLDPFKAYQTYFTLPSNGAGPAFEGLWYAFTIGSVRVVSINNDDVCYQDGGNTYVRGYSGGAQKTWLEQTLADARKDHAIDWIVVCMHQVAISTAIPFNGCELGVRQAWLPLFDRYGVDLVVCGHEHHYERTFPLRGQEGQYLRPVAASQDVDVIDTGAGTVHMVLGGGGHSSPSNNLYSIKDGMFEAEILAPRDPGAPTAPGVPIPLITPKPRETATWSPTTLSADPTLSHARDTGHGYGFASFEVDPTVPGGWTTMTVHYHRVLDPQNPADNGKEVEFDSFVLRRRRSDSDEEKPGRRAGTEAERQPILVVS